MAGGFLDKRLTRFPGDQPSISHIQSETAIKGTKNARRMTRFPGGAEVDLPLLTAASLKSTLIKRHERIQTEQIPCRLPLIVKKTIQPLLSKIDETAEAISNPDTPPKQSALAVYHQNP